MSKPVIRLTKKVKERWLKALRSGKFIQGNGQLFEKDKMIYDDEFGNGKECKAYCCLGVIASVEGLMKSKKCRGDFGFLTRDGEELSAPLVEGLEHGVQKKLAKMNDDGTPFKDIADYIEKNVPAVK